MTNVSGLPAIVVESGFGKYLKEINNIPSLTKEEEFLLAKNYLEDNDLEAAHKLVASHLKLVVKIALNYKNYGLPISELVSEGNIGLMQSVKKYNPDLGHRLSTYAMWWIKASIQEYVLKSWSLVKIGTTAAQKKLFFSLGKIKNKIINTSAREINSSDYAQIAADLGVNEQEVAEMHLRLSGPDMSLNRSVSRDSDSAEIMDFLPENRPSSETLLMNREILGNKKKALVEAMKILNEREADIFRARKLSDSPATLDALSRQYNISKERIRQIETRAFEKIRDFVLQKVSGEGGWIAAGG